MIIAIDGPAAAGKGTIALRLAIHYQLPYLDSGLLYRFVGRRLVEQGCDLADEAAAVRVAASITPDDLNDPRLRGREAGEVASEVAVLPGLRQALLAYQRDFAHGPRGAILDGRDIGTAICPDADVKIYVTASPEIRARRRTDELRAKGRDVEYDRILGEIRERDARDSGRKAAPLARASDAVVLDTSDIDIDGAVDAALHIVERVKSAA